MLSTARPSPLRLAGFVCTVAGVALMAAGAFTAWASVALKAAPGQPPNTSLTSTYLGVDTWEGIVVLVAAIVALLAVMGTRLVRDPAAARALALVCVVMGVVVVAIAVATLVRVEDRYTDPAAESIAVALAKQTGLPVAAIEHQLETTRAGLVEVDAGIGIPLALAGGVLGAIGGVLVAAWTRRRRLVGGVEEPLGDGPVDAEADAASGDSAPAETGEPMPGPGPDPLFPAVGDDPGPHEPGS